MERQDFIEKIMGGIFAVIAVAAAIAELIINGVSPSMVASCVKDVFGTLVVIVLFFSVVKDSIPSKNFKKVFDNAMNKVSDKYKPLIKKEEVKESSEAPDSKYTIAKRNKLQNVICYSMASKIDVLFGISCNDYPRFMEIHNDETTIIKFLIRQRFFDSADYTKEKLKDIGNKIKQNLELRFRDYEFRFDENKTEIYVNVKRIMKSNKDAQLLSELADSAIMLYIAERKK